MIDESRDGEAAANTAASPIHEAPTPDAEAPEEEPAQFSAEYVKSLRSEAAQRRREVKEGQERITSMEAELVELRESAFRRALADANAGQMRRLVDPEDLLTFGDRDALMDDDGRPDRAKIEAAIGELVQRKPHLAIASGSPMRGVMPYGAPVAPLGLGALVGAAARGESIDRR